MVYKKGLNLNNNTKLFIKGAANLIEGIKSKTKTDNVILMSHLSTLNELLCEIIPGIESILLTGSYARGAGTYTSNIPDSDYDIYIVTKTNYSIQSKCKIWNNIREQRNIGIKFTCDLHFISLNELKTLPPYFRYYDLKHHSIVIYGKDVRKYIPNILVNSFSEYEVFRFLIGPLYKIIQHDAGVNKTPFQKQLKTCAYTLKCGREMLKGDYNPIQIIEPETQDMNFYISQIISTIEKLYDGYEETADKHLLQYISYKLNINSKLILKPLSCFVQLLLTLDWCLTSKQLKNIDWRDPAIKIYFAIIYYFKNQEESIYYLNKVKSYDDKRSLAEQIVVCYEQYFHNPFNAKGILKRIRRIDCFPAIHFY